MSHQTNQPPTDFSTSPHGSPRSTNHQSLTKHLLSHSPDLLSRATQSPFLRAAGQGTLPQNILSQWLSQDRLYAQSYIGFIGALISRVDLPHANVASHGNDKSESLRWRIVEMLRGALENIFTELKFFADTAEKYGLDLEATPSEGEGRGEFKAVQATNQYIDLFRGFAYAQSRDSLLDGLIVLWATEYVYLTAWKWARSCQGSGAEAGSKGQEDDGKDADAGALRNEFIPNWTSDGFEDFVNQIGKLLDEWALRQGVMTDNKKMKEVEQLWEQILDIEERFWPTV